MQRSITFQSRWVLPISGPPIPDGFVTIDDRQIIQVSASPPAGQPLRALGDRILLPRLVNAHTHLEFSTLPGPFAVAGGFPGWVREVIKWRQQRDAANLAPDAAPHVAAIAAGVEESRQRGVGLVGEIATAPWPLGGYDPEPFAVLFLEQLGVLPGQADERLAAVSTRLSELRASQASKAFRIGLSPHAPYSLSESLFEGLVELACREHLPLAMHLAETREEVEWLAGASNGFSALQERLGVPNESQWRPALGWLLDRLAGATTALVIHGNFLSPPHWQQLARNRERLSVVFCPRTHRYFGHPRYPLVEMLSAGVRVAIGTDSRASNPDLDVLEELRLVRKLYPELEPAEVLRLGTLRGAEALGQADRYGQLAPGRSSRLLSARCPVDAGLDPIAWLLDSDVKVEPLDLLSAE